MLIFNNLKINYSMKKLLLSLGVAAAMLSSCTVYHSVDVTGSAIGTKEGKTTLGPFGSKAFGMKAAAEKGKIETIGAYETTTKLYLIFPVTTLKVYGE